MISGRILPQMVRTYSICFVALMIALCIGCAELKRQDWPDAGRSLNNPPPGAEFNPVDITPSYLSLMPVNAHTIAVDGNYLYIASVKGMEIFDISNRRNPVWVSNIDLPRGSFDFVIHDDTACTVSGDRSFTLVDISDPINARVINACTTRSSAYCTAIDDDRVYIGGVNRSNMPENAQLEIYDITYPQAPTELMSMEMEDRINDILPTDEYIYLAAGENGLVILENDPESLFREVGSFPMEEADGVAVDGNYAWVTDGSGIRAVDISNPSNPRDAGYLELNGIPQKVFIRDGYALAGDYNNGVHICELNPPDSITRTALIERVSEFMTFAMSGDFVYVPYRFGISVYDVGRPDSPEEVGLYPVIGDCQALCIEGGYAYTMDYYGLRVIYIDPPESAHVVGFLETEPHHRFDSLIFSDNRVYANDQDGGVLIFNVETPSEPTLEKEVRSGIYHMHGVFDGLVCHSDSTHVLHITDILYPGSPLAVWNQPMPGAIESFERRENRAYVVSDNLDLLDTSNPVNPEIVNSIEFPWELIDIDEAERVAYAMELSNMTFPSAGWSSADYELHSVDITSLNNDRASSTGTPLPRILDTRDYGTLSTNYSADVAGDYLYLVINGNLDIIDVSSPENLTRVGSYPMTTAPQPYYGAPGIRVENGYAWLHNGSLKILKLW